MEIGSNYYSQFLKGVNKTQINIKIYKPLCFMKHLVFVNKIILLKRVILSKKIKTKHCCHHQL